MYSRPSIQCFRFLVIKICGKTAIVLCDVRSGQLVRVGWFGLGAIYTLGGLVKWVVLSALIWEGWFGWLDSRAIQLLWLDSVGLFSFRWFDTVGLNWLVWFCSLSGFLSLGRIIWTDYFSSILIFFQLIYIVTGQPNPLRSSGKMVWYKRYEEYETTSQVLLEQL